MMLKSERISRVLKLGVAVAALTTSLCWGQKADADTLKLTFTGTATGITDSLNQFHLAPGVTSASFIDVFTFDLNNPGVNTAGGYDELYGGSDFGTTSPLLTSSLSINGHPVHFFGGFGDQVVYGPLTGGHGAQGFVSPGEVYPTYSNNAVIHTNAAVNLNTPFEAIGTTGPGNFQICADEDDCNFGDDVVGGFLDSTHITATIEPTTPEPDLVVNGDFETHDLAGWVKKSYPGTTVVSSSIGKDVSSGGKMKIVAFDGKSFARLVGVGCKNCLNPVPNGNFSQFFTDLVPGEHLTLVYHENDRDSGNSAPLDLKFGVPGDLVRYHPTAVGAPSGDGWQEYQAAFIATGDKELLSFQFQTAPTYFYGLDDVSLIDPPAGVPEPATWALMLGGFAGVGSTLRANRKGRRMTETSSLRAFEVFR